MPEYQVIGRTADGQTLVEIAAAAWGVWTHTVMTRPQALRAHKIGRTRKGTIILELTAAELAALAGDKMEIQLNNAERGPP